MKFNPGFEGEPTPERINKWLNDSDAYKRDQMKMYQKKFGLRTFIETGTFRGDAVREMKDVFDFVYSIELDKDYYYSLEREFGDVSNVWLIYGDSAIKLPELVGDNTQYDTLFWLDAHAGNPIRLTETPEQNYRGLIGVGKYDFSGLIELEYLLSKKLHNCVIMVDDIGDDPEKVCLHGGCGCINELMRIAPEAEVEMSVARIIIK